MWLKRLVALSAMLMTSQLYASDVDTTLGRSLVDLSDQDSVTLAIDSESSHVLFEIGKDWFSLVDASCASNNGRRDFVSFELAAKS